MLIHCIFTSNFHVHNMETESTWGKKLRTINLYGHRLHRHRIKSKKADIEIESTSTKPTPNNRHRHRPRKCENIDIESKISDISTHHYCRHLRRARHIKILPSTDGVTTVTAPTSGSLSGVQRASRYCIYC